MQIMARGARASLVLAGIAGAVLLSGCAPGQQVTHGVVSDMDYDPGGSTLIYVNNSPIFMPQAPSYSVTVIQCESPTNPNCLQQTFFVDEATYDALNIGDSYPLGYHDPLSNTAPPPSPAPASAGATPVPVEPASSASN